MLFAKADRLLDGSRKIKFQIPNIKKRNERKISNSDIRSLNFFYDYGPALFLKVNQFLDNGKDNILVHPSSEVYSFRKRCFPKLNRENNSSGKMELDSCTVVN